MQARRPGAYDPAMLNGNAEVTKKKKRRGCKEKQAIYKKVVIIPNTVRKIPIIKIPIPNTTIKSKENNMQNPIFKQFIQKLFHWGSLALGALSGLYGGFDFLLRGLLLFILIDYLSGLLCAGLGKSKKSPDGGLSSAVGWKGLFKKVMIMLAVLVSVLLDEALGQKNTFRNACILFYCSNELLSFLENLGLMGLPFPESLKKAISVLGKGEEKKE